MAVMISFVLVSGSVGMQYEKISLNGNWQLEPGEQKPAEFTHSVPVPGLVDLAEPPFKWEDHRFFWYKKQFRISKREEFQAIYLQLEQVKYGTRIWVNGREIGGDIPCYTSQEFDLTPFIQEGERNSLLIRVGSKETLPSHSAVGNDFEKLSFIPGIWGDVWLHLYGAGRVKWTRIIPDIENGSIQAHSEIENLTAIKRSVSLRYRIYEKKSGKPVGESLQKGVAVKGQSVAVSDTVISLPDFELWSPEHPFLYELKVVLRISDTISHETTIPFGMRKFEIRRGDFYLNGKRRVLMGSNIAFHRLLSDTTRGELPWDKKWIKKVLVDIPQQHNMFFFRFHLGHAYNRWYDIADQYGIMLQDEWMFWTRTGSALQIETEFRDWIRENINHPSIVIWDALNESFDSTIVHDIIPRLKEIDPTRPWETADFNEDHPYIYSLGPVLNSKKFGFSRSIFDLQNSSTPTMVNEYLWWWLDYQGQPTSLTEIVLERWLGREPSVNQMLAHQAFLATELTELWRRLDLDAILPFVYLSVGYGPTANWFLGSLKELKPKPVLKALKNAFSPEGLSIELWDRHFLTTEKREIPAYLFNDSQTDTTVQLEVYFDKHPSKSIFKTTIRLAAHSHLTRSVPVGFPPEPGDEQLVARLLDMSGKEIAFSKKPVIIFEPLSVPDVDELAGLSVLDPAGEITGYLSVKGIKYYSFPDGLSEAETVLINGKGIRDIDEKMIQKLTLYVRNGGILIFQEPEYEVKDEIEFPVVDDVNLVVKYREDPERGGYDSYVFPGTTGHFLWKSIRPQDLRMFNGALGGEMVSQHKVVPTVPYHTVASSNIELKVPVVMEIPYGRGWIIFSRIQIRGRLLPEKSSTELYGRRYDPVAELYFRNLITGYRDRKDYHQKIREKLSQIKIYIARIRASSGQIYDAVDGKMTTRWASKMEDPQWVWLDFGRPTELNKLTIHWEVAYGKVYEIFKSPDNENWEMIYREENSDGGKDEVFFKNMETRYLKIVFKKRGTKWGYSIWEMEFE